MAVAIDAEPHATWIPSSANDSRTGWTSRSTRSRLEVGVGHLLASIGKQLEAGERLVERVPLQLVPELGEARCERMAPRVLPQDEPRLSRADVARAHDLVGALVFQHPVLMDAALVRERVGADDRLVRLHVHPRASAHDLARANELRRVDPGAQPEMRRARLEEHHHLLERSVPGAFADTVDRHLCLPGGGAEAGHRVRGRQPQIVVAMDREGITLSWRRARRPGSRR